MDYFRVQGLLSSDNEVSTLRSGGRHVDSNSGGAKSDDEARANDVKQPPKPTAQRSPPLQPVYDLNYRNQYGYKGPYQRKIDLTTMARLKTK